MRISEIRLNPHSVTAVILAGGKGRRLSGQDKGLIHFHQRPVIEYILEMLRPLDIDILINANRNAEQYADYGHPVIGDDLSNFQGPLAGFSVAMTQVATSHILTLPCDGPLINEEYITRMLSTVSANHEQIAVAHDGERLQPVHALIPVALLDDLNQYLLGENRKIDLWYNRHSVFPVDFSDIPEIFLNINTEEQHQQLEKVYRDKLS